MTTEESTARFVGLRLSDMPPVIEAKLGRKLPAGWVDQLRNKLMQLLAAEVQPMPGAHDVLRATSALGLPYRVASNSSHEEMAVKFERIAMADLVHGRTHSARDVAAGKPAPDLFLYAAAQSGIPPAACLVVEDSVPGAQAARAAGMACIGLAPNGDDPALRAAGAVLIRSLAELPAILRQAQRVAA